MFLATKGHLDVSGLGCCLRSCWWSRDFTDIKEQMDLDDCDAAWGHSDILVQDATKGSLRPWSYWAGICVSILMTQVTTKCHADVQSEMPPETMWISESFTATWGHTDLSGLHCILRSWWHSGPCCHQEPYWGPRLYHSWSLCWCPKLMVPPKAMCMPFIWTSAWDHVIWALNWTGPVLHLNSIGHIALLIGVQVSGHQEHETSRAVSVPHKLQT